MPQFIIHSFPRNPDGSFSSKSTSSQLLKPRGTPLGLIDCEQIVREPIIAPESCVILESSSSNSNNSSDQVRNSSSSDLINNEVLRNRKHIEITQLIGGGESGAWHGGPTEHSIDSQALLQKKNLIVITVTGNRDSKSSVDTLELHFNCGIDRFFLIGRPCKLLLTGSLRVHQPTVELFFGLNLLIVSGNTMIYVNGPNDDVYNVDESFEPVVDVYAKVNSYEHISNRQELAFEFYGQVPNGQTGENGFGKSGDKNSIHPEYVLYFTMYGRKRAVAVFHGMLTTSSGDAYKPLAVNIYEQVEKKKKGGSPVGAQALSTLDVSLVMNETNCKDRHQVMQHPQLSNISASGSATVHVCSLNKACFSFSGTGNQLKVGGYLALQSSGTVNQLLPAGSEVVVKSGVVRLYVDDYFAVLALDSEAVEFEVDQRNKSKELSSISLMNINKQRPSRSSKKKDSGSFLSSRSSHHHSTSA